jgi:molecular chaperone DnaK (HSP70)
VAGYHLGVDLGTTWTAAAVARADGTVETISLGGRGAAVPTVLYVQADGQIVAGDAAVRRAVAEPERVTREFKRRIGDTVPILVAGAPYSAEGLLVTVLRWVVARVSEQEGGAPDSIVVTHPANWGPLRRELLEQALAHSGVVATTVTEPEAAAIHYASTTRVPDGTVFAVYDLGGGTFDASVLRKAGSSFEVLGQPEGIERFGGLDVDAAVLNHVTEHFAPVWEALDPGDPAVLPAVAGLREDCIAAKEALSEDAEASVPVVLPGISTEVRITRRELEAMVRPGVERSADVLQRAIEGAGLTVDQIDRILLVGGASRMPVVAEVL